MDLEFGVELDLSLASRGHLAYIAADEFCFHQNFASTNQRNQFSPKRRSISLARGSTPETSPKLEFQKFLLVSTVSPVDDFAAPNSISPRSLKSGEDQLFVMQPTLAMIKQNAQAITKKRIKIPSKPRIDHDVRRPRPRFPNTQRGTLANLKFGV